MSHATYGAAKLNPGHLASKYYNALVEVPFEGTFALSELGDSKLAGRMRKANQDGAIVVVEIERVPADTSPNHRQRYRVDEQIKRAFDDLEPDLRMPCGHRGIKHHHDGSFGCGADWCNETFGRDTVEGVLGE